MRGMARCQFGRERRSSNVLQGEMEAIVSLDSALDLSGGEDDFPRVRTRPSGSFTGERGS